MSGYSLNATVQTPRLLLRPITVADAADVFAYASDPAVTRYVTWPTHQSVADSLDFVTRVERGYGQGPVLHWAITQTDVGKMIGSCAVSDVDDANSTAEIGYVLARAHWGSGIMTEAVRTVLDALFRHTPLNRIEAFCLPANHASARVLEKSGLTFEGIRREGHFFKDAFHDAKVYAILRKDWGR